MSCGPCSATTREFDAAVARRDLRRYRRRGPDAQTRRLVAAVQARVLPSQATLLDIGGGVGAVHHVLLEGGFASATHVDASGAYLDAAAEESRRIGHGERVQFQLAQFPGEGSDVAPADVVTLDRVVCCDPDYTRLLSAAAERARHVLAFSFPRPHGIARLMIGGSNLVRAIMRREFRAYVHPPDAMRSVLERAGMRQASAGGTWIWAVEVFERRA